MSTLSPDTVRAALRAVIDPDSGRDVVNSGMITGLSVREGRVGFALEVAPERGPAAEPLRAACEAAVLGLPGVAEVLVVLTAHGREPGAAPATDAPRGVRVQKPSSQSRPQPGAQSGAPRAAGSVAPPGVRHIVAVASGKGGVGKSTVAVNLALGLSALGLKTGLLDADIYGPSVPHLLGLSGEPKKSGDKLIPMRAHGISAMSIGFLVDVDTPMIWRGPMVMSAISQMLADVAWGELDVLIVDMPPGTGDAQLTMAQRVRLAGAIIVSTPQDLALIDARKAVAMFRRTEVPVLGLVENMSTFVCPHCGTESHIFGHGGAEAAAETLSVPFFGAIPLEMRIRALSDAGTPVVAAAIASREAEAYLAIAKQTIDALAGTAQKPPPRIVFED